MLCWRIEFYPKLLTFAKQTLFSAFQIFMIVQTSPDSAWIRVTSYQRWMVNTETPKYSKCWEYPAIKSRYINTTSITSSPRLREYWEERGKDCKIQSSTVMKRCCWLWHGYDNHEHPIVVLTYSRPAYKRDSPKDRWLGVVDSFNPSIWEAEVGSSLTLKQAWSTEQVQGQPGLHSETL